MLRYGIDQLRESMVKIIGSDGTTVAGSGFIIRPDGYLVTCHHVICQLASLKVEYRGQSYEAQWCKDLSDPEVDIAILKIDVEGVKAATIINPRHLSASVIVYGFPHAKKTNFPAGFDVSAQNIRQSAPLNTVSTFRTREIKFLKTWNKLPQNDSTFLAYRIDAKVDPGTSGGPVFAENLGGVVGIIQCKNSNESYVIRWDNIKKTLNELGLEPQKNAVCQFLEGIKNDKRFKPFRFCRTQQEVDLEKQYVPIQVTFERKPRRAVETWDYIESETDLRRIYALKGTEDESKINQLNWAEVREQNKRIIILADPGMGKSILLKMETKLIAQEEEYQLSSNKKSISNTIFPLFLSLYDLNKKLNEKSQEIIEIILLLIQRDYPNTVTLEIKQHLEEKLNMGKCVLLLDALDEVPKEDKRCLLEKLNRFAQNYSCPIICTSRVAGYTRAFVEGFEEVEIVPFSQKQIQDYVKFWFTNATGHINTNLVSADNLLRELQNKPQVWGLAQNPLLLSLLCSLYQEKGGTLPSRRSQVYEKAVDCMLNTWSQNRKPVSGVRTEAKKRLLEELAYRFSCESRDIFSLGALYEKVEEYIQGKSVSTIFKDSNSDDLITELSELDGILQKMVREGDSYLFLHRTFQEYLTASYLERSSDTIALAKEHFWKYDWHETLSLLAGLTKDPLSLIQAITREKDDVFSSLLLLAGQCIADCELPSPFAMDVVDRIYNLWHSHPSVGFIKLSVVRLGRVNSHVLERLLQEALEDSSRNVRLEVLHILGEVKSHRSVELLTQILDDPVQDDYVKKLVVLVLGRINNSQAIEALIKVFKEHDDTFIKWVIAVLGKIGDSQAVEALIQVLNPSDETVINCVRLKLKDCVTCILQRADWTLTSSERISSLFVDEELIQVFSFLYGDVRREVVTTLGKIGKPQVVNALIQTLNSLNSNIRSWIVVALEEISKPQEIELLIQGCYANWNDSVDWNMTVLAGTDNLKSVEVSTYALDLPIGELRRETINILEKISKQQAVEDLIQDLYPLFRDVTKEAAVALGKIGDPQAVEALIRTLNENSDINIRREAVMALGLTGSSQAIEILITAFDDCEKDIRWRAAAALGEIAKPQAVEALIQVLNHSDSDVRREATDALGKSDSSQAVEVLIQALRCQDGEARRLAAAALGKTRWTSDVLRETENLRVVEALIEFLHDPDSYIRRWVAVALGKIRSQKAVGELVQTLNDLDNDVKKHAVVALGRIRHPQAVEALVQALNDKAWDVRGHAAIALGKILSVQAVKDSQAVKELIRNLDSPDHSIRMWVAVTLVKIQWAVYAIGGKHNWKAIEVLIEELDPPDSNLRWQTTSALRKIGGTQVTKALVQALSDPNSDIRGLAAASLGEIGSTRAISALVQAVSHPDKEVRREAIAALKKMDSSENSALALKRLTHFPEVDLYNPDVFSLARTLMVRANVTQKKTLFIPTYYNKVRVIDTIYFFYRQLIRFFL